jgi:hypothetical protein
MSTRAAADVDAIERDVDAVLRRLPVRDTYRANMFRVTGVLGDATPAQIRRRREEVTMAARLGTALPSPFGDLAPDPVPHADEVKAAFEAMQSPVLRLVHEALWLSGVATHDAAVAAHTKALDDPDADDDQWRAALAAWATTLDDDAYWFRLERRAKELDDPRVSVATVAALRSRLPRRVLAPNAERATAAAGAGDTATVSRHLALLHAAPFPAETVAAALREACNPVTDRIHDQCAALTEACADAPSEIVERCTDLLAAAPRLLAVPAAVLPSADGLSNALHDEIANTVTRAAVAWVNDGGDPALVQPLLDGAADLAREKTTVDLVDRTRRGLAEAAVLAVVEPWISAGNPDGAVEVLHRWRRRGVEPHLADEVARVAADPRAIRAALEDVPTRAVFGGCGVRPARPPCVGRRHLGGDPVRYRVLRAGLPAGLVPVRRGIRLRPGADDPLGTRPAPRPADRPPPAGLSAGARPVGHAGGRVGDRRRAGRRRGATTTQHRRLAGRTHRGSAVMTTRDPQDDVYADALTNLWRAGRKLSAAGSDEQRQAARHLRAACTALAEAGLSFQDHDGTAFDPGLALEVIAYEPRADASAETVVETVRPCVYRNGRRIQIGQVIVARPEKKKRLLGGRS